MMNATHLRIDRLVTMVWGGMLLLALLSGLRPEASPAPAEDAEAQVAVGHASAPGAAR